MVTIITYGAVQIYSDKKCLCNDNVFRWAVTKHVAPDAEITLNLVTLDFTMHGIVRISNLACMPWLQKFLIQQTSKIIHFGSLAKHVTKVLVF